MIWLLVLVVALMLSGSVLAMAEASLTRIRSRPGPGLEDEGRRYASRLVQIEEDPYYLNAIYLWVMIVQNGSAILVAFLADAYFEHNLAITLVSVGFTLLYFVVVEAMSKTFAILPPTRVALRLAPVVFWLSRVLCTRSRVLIGIANILLPGKGIREGPSSPRRRSEPWPRPGARRGHRGGGEGAHPLHLRVRRHRRPRGHDPRARHRSRGGPGALERVQDLVIRHGYSRIPVYRERLEDIVGIVYAKDVLRERGTPTSAAAWKSWPASRCSSPNRRGSPTS